MRIDLDRYRRVIYCAESKFNYLLFINLRAKLCNTILPEKLNLAKTVNDLFQIANTHNAACHITYEDIIDILHRGNYRLTNLDINLQSHYVYIEYIRDNYCKVLRDMRELDYAKNGSIKYVKDIALAYGISTPVYYIYVYDTESAVH